MFDGISIWQLLILLAIVLLVFGSKRLRNLGPDLGSAYKGFRSAMKDDEAEEGQSDKDPKVDDHVQRENSAQQGGEHKVSSEKTTQHRD